MSAGISLRVRKVDAGGDRVFGGDQAAFLRNTPAAVGQICESRLNLWTGQWYLDLDEGTPYETEVFGFRTDASRDAALQARILTTPGVADLASYGSTLDRQTRAFAPTIVIDTVFSAANLRAEADARTSVRLPVEQDR